MCRTPGSVKKREKFHLFHLVSEGKGNLCIPNLGRDLTDDRSRSKYPIIAREWKQRSEQETSCSTTPETSYSPTANLSGVTRIKGVKKLTKALSAKIRCHGKDTCEDKNYCLAHCCKTKLTYIQHHPSLTCDGLEVNTSKNLYLNNGERSDEMIDHAQHIYEIKAWKKFRHERGSNPWPLRYRLVW